MKIKTREELVAKLEAAAAWAGEKMPLGIGTFFWMDMRLAMLRRDPDLEEYTMADALRFGKVGKWRDHDLYIIPGNLRMEDMDDPRPWTGVVA